MNAEFADSPQISVAQIPLTTWQKMVLIGGCVPLVSFLVLTGIFVVVARSLVRDSQIPFFVLFVGAVVLVLGYQAVQRLRDLASGTVLVREDVLTRSWRSRRGRSLWGSFEHLGRLRMMGRAFFRTNTMGRYRVYYSPISRLVWQVEPLGLNEA